MMEELHEIGEFARRCDANLDLYPFSPEKALKAQLKEYMLSRRRPGYFGGEILASLLVESQSQNALQPLVKLSHFNL